MPGVLKNLIDWTSRFRPQPFDGKHGLLMSASPSMGGGNRGLWALRMPLEHLGARIYPDMFSLAQAHKTLVDGDIEDARLRERFEKNYWVCPRGAAKTIVYEPLGSSSSGNRPHRGRP